MLSHFSRVGLFAALWTVAHQALLSMRFSRQEYWSGLPCPPPGDLPNPETEPVSRDSYVSCTGMWTLPLAPPVQTVTLRGFEDLMLSVTTGIDNM